MMKPHHSIFIIFGLALFSCSTEPAGKVATMPMLIDSFSVSGIDAGQQVQDFRYLNDTALCAYDPLERRLVFFYKNKSGNYHAAVKKDIDAIFMSSFFLDDRHNNYFISQDKFMVVYNPTADSLLWKTTFHHNFSYLKDTFGIFSTNNTPVIKRGDTIITGIGHGVFENYKNYFKEQEISEFKIDSAKDTITYLRSYISKPANLIDYEYPFGTYCFYKNSIFLLYPPMDTLYIFNRSSNSISKIHIQNTDYKLPEKFTCKPFTPEYGSCETKYHLHNFNYMAIHYNPITKHFILFYKAPVNETIKDRMPVFDDQPLQALILDEQFNQIDYLMFNKHFVQSSSYFFIPGKGFAMPIYNGNDFETSLFYIYNL